MAVTDDLERLRALYDDWGAGRYEDVAIYDPEVKFVVSDEFPDAGIYRGHEGVLEGFGRWVRAWEGFRIVAEEMAPAPDGRIVVLTRYLGRGRGSGLEIDREAAHVWTMRDGRAVRQEIYADREPGLRALGRA